MGRALADSSKAANTRDHQFVGSIASDRKPLACLRHSLIKYISASMLNYLRCRAICRRKCRPRSCPANADDHVVYLCHHYPIGLTQARKRGVWHAGCRMAKGCTGMTNGTCAHLNSLKRDQRQTRPFKKFPKIQTTIIRRSIYLILCV